VTGDLLASSRIRIISFIWESEIFEPSMVILEPDAVLIAILTSGFR